MIAKVFQQILSMYNSGAENPGCRVARSPGRQGDLLCSMAPNICWSVVWNLLHVNSLAPRILRWLQEFWKIYVPLFYSGTGGSDGLIDVATLIAFWMTEGSCFEKIFLFQSVHTGPGTQQTSYTTATWSAFP